MPSLKVFVDTKDPVSDAVLETLNDVVIKGLEAHGEHAVVAVIPDAKVNLSGCYVELTCRHKANRTPEILQALAETLDQTTRSLFGLNDPVRVRIIMVEENLLGAVN
ncbi:hypothetical protein Q5Y75_04585 [Ruegeria sp. 2205SS24-7]|uniref:hypothetical protein n=1 Tax=Ruegeria discodermiae TaxID=3064389 RepID=UPI0027426C5D|nr:hypothetical protein [Ruegeria sp. 2205SS24-7]MDP5216484.1 hypothetical protein [Ruegeria sp. 2205SS24-7]